MSRTLRIFIDLLMAISILQGWWFVALALGIIGVWRFSYFIEIIIAGVIYDSLFGFTPALGFLGYAGTIVSAVSFTAMVLLKKIVRR